LFFSTKQPIPMPPDPKRQINFHEPIDLGFSGFNGSANKNSANA
jgi:hypothetical protein